MKKGKLIVIEGTDCSGKRTQTELLIKNLKEEGILCENLSFPMYDSPTGKIIAGPYLQSHNITLKGTFQKEHLMFQPKLQVYISQLTENII
jgi:thymidylate kinase